MTNRKPNNEAYNENNGQSNRLKLAWQTKTAVFLMMVVLLLALQGCWAMGAKSHGDGINGLINEEDIEDIDLNDYVD